MNRRLVAGIAGLAMLLTAGFAQDCFAFRHGCGGGKSRCDGGGGGLFSHSRGGDCGGAATCGRANDCGRGGGGLFSRLRGGRDGGRQASCGCPQPAPSCCAPVNDCCAPAPAPACCPAPQPSCGGCAAPVSACGCGQAVNNCGSCGSCGSYGGYGGWGGTVAGGCVNCSPTMDSGMIYESSVPSEAPPAPAPTPDPAANAPSSGPST